MRDRESKKQALFELIQKNPEAVVDLLLDLMRKCKNPAIYRMSCYQFLEGLFRILF